MITEVAPAKINLYLHIGPVRHDGLHDLASLFVFAEDGDLISVQASNTISLDIIGPFAEQLSAFPVEDNLVWRAAEKLKALTGVSKGASITLHKNLPIAAGVGGGSTDAAATLRALVRLWGVDVSDDALAKLAFSLGADVPACLEKRPVNVTGAGEVIEKGPGLPPLWCCLVNPCVPMPTGPIFRAFDAKNTSPESPRLASIGVSNYSNLLRALAASRNDLEYFACERAPLVSDILKQLAAAPGVVASRMSGSGATCFALFTSRMAAERAAMRAKANGWWALASGVHVR